MSIFGGLFSKKGSGGSLGVPDPPKDEFKLPDPPKNELKSFPYQPLNSASDEIRIVRAQLNCSKDDLRFDIRNVAIKNAPPFKALSYAWGKRSAGTHIKLNNIVCRVNDTLHQFLVQVTERSEDAQAYYWIDAICIDQGNVAERNEQVLRMKEIYEAAAQIVVWLGSPRIPRLMVPSDLSDPIGRVIGDALGTRPSGQFLTERVLALDRMYEDTWWERAWIIQEASTPAIKDNSLSNVVWIGPYRYDLDTCLLIPKIYDKVAVSPDRRNRLPTMVEDLAWIRARRSEIVSRLEIYDLLPRVRRYDASDMRDKIYSILAISCDYDAKDLKPDYGKPTSEIYTGLVRYLIERDRKLDILAYCAKERNIEDLPSWVPDWSYKNVPVPFPRRSYNACGNLPWRVSFQNWGSSIRCKGVQIASIHAVGPARNKAAEYSSNQSAVSQSWFTFGMMSLSPNAYDLTYEKRLDTLRRVVCANVSEWDGSAKRRHIVTWPFKDPSGRFEFSERDFIKDSDMDKATNLRRLMCLDNDLLGLGPAEASAGDFVYVLCGLPVPLVLRKFREHFLIVGECYVYGIMDAQRPWGQHQIRDIDIW